MKQTAEIVVSLDPDDFEYVVSLNPDDFEEPPPPPVPQRPENFGPRDIEPFSSDEKKNCYIRNCHPLIPEVLEYIAAKRNRSKAEVGLVAFYIGKNLLWSEPAATWVKISQ